MANQHFGNLKMHLEEVHGMHIVDILMELREKNYSYQNVSDEYGFHLSSVKRVFFKYGIRLKAKKRVFHTEKVTKPSFLDRFRNPKLNIDNILYRPWVCHV